MEVDENGVGSSNGFVSSEWVEANGFSVNWAVYTTTISMLAE